MPKFNLYQSLHTTVIGPSGKPIEVQIRTQEMHQRAEWGVAAHWAYKGDGRDAATSTGSTGSSTGRPTSPTRRQFMENLKTDLEQDEVFVFTPKGRVITLPVGSTTVDFAYAVHTEVGHACIGAKVNGRLVPLDHVLPAATRARSSPRRSRPPGRRRTGWRSSRRRGRATRSASGSAASGAST